MKSASSAESSKKTPTKTGSRRRARECALQLLFALDGVVSDVVVDQSLLLFWRHVAPVDRQSESVWDIRDESALEDPETVEFASQLVRGVNSHLLFLDASIQKHAQNWRVERMSRCDRNVLRLATYELYFMKKTPLNVVVNEAIDIAKKYGTDESGSFVNGLIDRVAHAR